MIRTRRSAGRSRVALAALVTVGGVVLAGCAAGQQAQTAEQRPTIDGNNAEIGPLALRNIAIEYPDNGLYRRGAVARLRLLIANTGNASDELTDVRTDVAGEVAIVAGQTEDDSAPSGSATATVTPSGTPAETGAPTPTGTATPSETGTATPTEGPSSADQSVSATPPDPSQSPAASPSETGPIPGTTVTIAPNYSVSIGEGTSGSAILLRGLTRELRSTEVVSITFVFRDAGSVTVPVPVAIPTEREAAPTIPAESDEEAGEPGT